MDSPKKRYTIKDVSKESGFSLSTVSLVFNENTRISQATRDRVLQTIQRLGYQPNRMARALACKHTHTIAVLLPQLRHTFADVYFGEIISGMYDQASRLGYKILLEMARADFIESKEHLRLYDQKFVDGILFVGSNARHRFVADFVGGGRPFLLVNNYSKEFDLNYVVSNYKYGAWQAAQHLIRLGHRRIGFIGGGLTEIQTSRDVLAGFQEAHDEHKIPFDSSLVEDGWLTEEGGSQAIQKLLQRASDLTAVFALNDKMAFGVMKQLSERGVRVPDEMAVVGFDDIPQASYSIPGLTTVHQPLYEIGKIACEQMVGLIHGRTDRVQETLPIHLVVRESCGTKTKQTLLPAPS